MTALKERAEEVNRFWDFSVAYYQQPGVAEQLLFLQRQYGFNVNLILYFFWQAMLGEGGLSQKKVHKLIVIVAPWHNKVVLPLRRLRDTLKKQSANEPNYAELKKELGQEELRAERFEQLILYQQVWIDRGRARSSTQKISDICRSVSSYCYLMRVKADEQLVQAVNALLHVLLPKSSPDKIAKISSERLHNHPNMSKVVGTQLWLDL